MFTPDEETMIRLGLAEVRILELSVGPKHDAARAKLPTKALLVTDRTWDPDAPRSPFTDPGVGRLWRVAVHLRYRQATPVASGQAWKTWELRPDKGLPPLGALVRVFWHRSPCGWYLPKGVEQPETPPEPPPPPPPPQLGLPLDEDS